MGEQCKCWASSEAVYGDLLNALDRLNGRKITDKKTQRYLSAYRDALLNAYERFKVTTVNYCPRVEEQK